MSDEAGKNSSYSRGRGKRRRKVPLFGIILAALFVLIPGIFFYAGMRDAPERPDGSPELPPEEAAVTAQPDDDTPEPPQEPTPVPMPPAVKVRGIYYDVHFPQNNALQRNIEFIESTSLNAIVIDAKDDYGFITFDTDNEMYADAIAAFIEGFHRELITKETLADIKSRGIYTIARVVCFKDDFYTKSNPSNALQNKNGGVWRDNSSNAWLDPYNTANWEHILMVCKEAAAMGFDEVQLDYVRFPSDGQLGNINYGPAAQDQNRYQIINEFASFIREEMAFLGVRTSADILGIVGMSYLDAGAVGQNMQLLLGSLDSICPMIYPSHFANSSDGIAGNGVGQFINGILFERPDLEPHGVVYNTLAHYMDQVNTFMENNPEANPAVIRPYLQYFSATYLREGYWIPYGAEEIQAQIQAVNDADFEEWILWRTSNGSLDIDAIP